MLELIIGIAVGLVFGGGSLWCVLRKKAHRLTELEQNLLLSQKKLLGQYKTERDDLIAERERYEDARMYLDQERVQAGAKAYAELKELRDAAEEARVLYVTKADELQQRINKYDNTTSSSS